MSFIIFQFPKIITFLLVFVTLSVMADSQVVYKENLEPISENALPLDIKVVQLHESSLLGSMFFQRNKSLPLVDGWYFSLEKLGCSNAKLKVSQAAFNQEDVFAIRQNRDAGLISRLFVNCGFNDGFPLHRIRMLGDRYFAFLTSEPGWILFDRTSGKFNPVVIRTRVNESSEIGMGQDDKVYVTHPASKGSVYRSSDSREKGLQHSSPSVGLGEKTLTITKQNSETTFVFK